MKNKEFYKNEILEINNANNASNSIAVVNDIPKNCKRIDCHACDLFNSINCLKELNKWLKKECDKPGGKEKKMKNKEFYKNEILEINNANNASNSIAVVNGIPKNCRRIDCHACDLFNSINCLKESNKWLEKEYDKTGE